MNIGEANRLRACLDCGEHGADDHVMSCDRCLACHVQGVIT